MTTNETTYQAGDQIDIGDATITLGCRKGNTGIRWTWIVPSTDLSGEAYWPTPEAAIADAHKTMNTPECRHGEQGWCPRCHDDNQ